MSELPGDLLAIFGIGSSWLRQEWALAADKLAAVRAAAEAAGSPPGVVAVGQGADGEFLCWQPGWEGCRVGIYRRGLYSGPQPIATWLSEQIWRLEELRRSVPSKPMAIGHRVEHPSFGPGTVSAITGKEFVEVKFDRGDVCRIKTSFLKRA